MVRGADALVNIPTKPSLFHSESFYNRAQRFLQFLRQAHHFHAGCSAFSLLYFRRSKCRLCQWRTFLSKHRSSIRCPCSNHSHGDRFGSCVSWPITCKLRLLLKIRKKSDWRRPLRRGQLSLENMLSKRRDARSGSEIFIVRKMKLMTMAVKGSWRIILLK